MSVYHEKLGPRQPDELPLLSMSVDKETVREFLDDTISLLNHEWEELAAPDKTTRRRYQTILDVLLAIRTKLIGFKDDQQND